jgi:hypothetical protein
MGKGCIQSQRRSHQSQAVRTDDANAVALCGRAGASFEFGARRPGFAETRTDDDGRLDAGAAAFLDQARHGCCRRADDCEIGTLAQRVDAGHARVTLHRVVLGIDRVQIALEASFDHVASQERADRIAPLAGADDGHRLRFEEGREVMLFVHDEYSAECVRAAIGLPLPRGRRSRYGVGADFTLQVLRVRIENKYGHDIAPHNALL